MKKLTVIIALFGLSTLIASCTMGNGAPTTPAQISTSGARVIQNEFSPEAMLKKYEWFKTQSALIQKAQKDVQNLKAESDITGQYEKDNGKDHTKWSPLALNSYQEELSLNKQQRLAQVSNTNSLIASYNAQSAKFNWGGFMTRDDHPP